MNVFKPRLPLQDTNKSSMCGLNWADYMGWPQTECNTISTQYNSQQYNRMNTQMGHASKGIKELTKKQIKLLSQVDTLYFYYY